MKFVIVTLMPEMYAAIESTGVIGRALEEGIASLTTINPRNFTEDRHATVDDRPYGGGPGMVMKAEPMLKAIADAKREFGADVPVVHLSPRGRPLEQSEVTRWARDFKAMILVASRYEGLDQRAIDLAVDFEVNVGDFVVSGGDLPAMMAIDAVIRQLPGALGDDSSKNDESFIDGLLEYPQYTRPEQLGEARVPKVLLSGNHQQIDEWRKKQALLTTKARRPDLLVRRGLSPKEVEIVEAYEREARQQTED
jgi:tRNA (guanine37-N1)-methyltransferase